MHGDNLVGGLPIGRCGRPSNPSLVINSIKTEPSFEITLLISENGVLCPSKL